MCFVKTTTMVHAFILYRRRLNGLYCRVANIEFWKDLKTFLQFVESSTKSSSLFSACLETISIPTPTQVLPWRFIVYNIGSDRLKMIEQYYENGQFEKGRNMYVWNLANPQGFLWLSSIDHRLREHISDKTRDMLEMIAKLVIGCLYYSIKDLVLKGKNVIFAISTKEEKCKQLIDLIFINNSMIKKLLNCATIIPHCNTIDWYEKRNNTLIISKPDLLANSNNQDVTLLKLCIDGC